MTGVGDKRDKRGSMALAIFDAVISMMNLGLTILGLVELIRDKDPDVTRKEKNVGIVVVSVLAIICILQVLLAFRLYYGAKSRDYRNCRIWLIVTTIVTTINIISFILNFTASELIEETFGGTLFVIIYKIYELIVVFCFLRKLKQEAQGLGGGYTVTTLATYPQPQPVPIYATPQSQEVYPMQQYAAYPTVVTNQAYPAPVHHVTTSRIS